MFSVSSVSPLHQADVVESVHAPTSAGSDPATNRPDAQVVVLTRFHRASRCITVQAAVSEMLIMI